MAIPELSLGDRMKQFYEDPWRVKLPRRMPLVIRLDGRAFHTLTKGCTKPFDKDFSDAMAVAMKAVAAEAQGFKLGYMQSDEISLLLTDYDDLRTESWFASNLQKIVSISASVASVAFTMTWGLDAAFDARAFVLPPNEVTNYFIWRQKDCQRNAINSAGFAYLGHKAMQSLKIGEVVEKLTAGGWIIPETPLAGENGFLLVGGSDSVVEDAPIFQQERNLIDDIVFMRNKPEQEL